MHDFSARERLATVFFAQPVLNAAKIGGISPSETANYPYLPLKEEAPMLRTMTPTEFDQWAIYFVADYAEDLQANYGYAAERAQAEARHALTSVLPHGIATAHQQLLTLEEAGAVVGYLWYQQNETNAFIMDFMVLPHCRGQGHGRRALAELEAHLRAAGVAEMRLRVAADNPRARHLYEACDFQLTGYNMSKRL